MPWLEVGSHELHFIMYVACNPISDTAFVYNGLFLSKVSPFCAIWLFLEFRHIQIWENVPEVLNKLYIILENVSSFLLSAHTALYLILDGYNDQ